MDEANEYYGQGEHERMRVLFVVREYLPKTTPPGICVMNIQKALLSKGVHSDVLMVGEKEGCYSSSEIGDVYSIKAETSFEKKKDGILKYLKVHIPMIVTWPVLSMKRVRDYKRKIKALNSKKKYDAIIGTMFPPDVCVACCGFHHFFLYELDSLLNNPVYKDGIKKYLTYRLYRLERKLFECSELIIHLNNNRRFYDKDRYEKYKSKSVFTDIPNLIEGSRNEDNQEEESHYHTDTLDNHILLVYSGLLAKDYRSPLKLIELMKGVSKELNITCLFFSRGDCEDELRKAEIETNGMIKRMGYVSQQELASYTKRADFLLDIGNTLSGEDFSLPSKVIEYMAIGKPIIHMNGKNDIAIEYLKKYGLAINVGGGLSAMEDRDEVLKFIKGNMGKRIPFENVVKMFPQNTPEYTADLIINQIEHREENT